MPSPGARQFAIALALARCIRLLVEEEGLQPAAHGGSIILEFYFCVGPASVSKASSLVSGRGGEELTIGCSVALVLISCPWYSWALLPFWRDRMFRHAAVSAWMTAAS